MDVEKIGGGFGREVIDSRRILQAQKRQTHTKVDPLQFENFHL